MIYPKTLQGTDGIRRVVKYNVNKDPLEALLKDNVITEKFVECYTYAISKWIEAEKNDKVNIALGYDPRDKEKILIDYSVKGIRKAGANVYDMGIIPTPAIPLFLAKKGIDAGIMITASHNPKDQNGIKIFLKNGLKPFPKDDEALTTLFYDLFRDKKVNLESVKLSGQYIYSKNEAKKIFIDFITNPQNSWLDETINTSNTTIILDCANGSYSALLLNIFKTLGFEDVTMTASDLGEDVNEHSGVVCLDGISTISYNEMKDQFWNNNTIRTLFDKGREYSKEIKEMKWKVIAFIFDADGDRFYRAEYNPFSDKIIILSGDENAILQAKYLLKTFPNKMKNSLFISTIESDYNVYLTANKMKLKSILTGVGDKWILKKAFESYIIAIHNKLNKPLDIISEVFNKNDISSVEINRLFDNLLPEIKSNFNITDVSYCVGSEESGHNITTGLIEYENSYIMPIFAGNGLKSALNSFVATESLLGNKTIEKYFQEIENPFEKSFKKTFYVYYTNKNKLAESEYQEKLKGIIVSGFNMDSANGKLIPSEINLTEEKLAIIFNISYLNKEIGCLFVRNSGTEDKTGIYIRCLNEYSSQLLEVGKVTAEYIFLTMKEETNEYAKAEKEVLEYLYKFKKISESLLYELIEGFAISKDRLIKEMKKQQIIYYNNGNYFLEGENANDSREKNSH